MKAGWQKNKLGEVLAVLRNGVNCKQDKDGQGQKISRIESIADATFNLDRVGYAELSESDKGRYRLLTGDILFSHINSPVHVGKTAIFDSDEEVYHGVNLLLMRPKPEVSPAYLNYALKLLFQSGYWQRTCKQSVNQASVNQQDISKVEIQYPCSLAEQQRIVAILDEAFAGIATARAAAEQNRQNARALFESHLQSIFTQRDEAWVELSLSSLLEKQWIVDHMDGNHGGDYPRKDEFIQSGVPYISANCIDDDLVNISRAKFLSSERAKKLRKGFAKNGDVLFAHNATVGPVAILRTDEPVVILGTSLTYYRCDTRHVLPEYLAHYMRSSYFRGQYQQIMKQSTRNQVPITKQREFMHVIPPIDKQRAIVAALDKLFDGARDLDLIYQRKLAALDELKQSLLHQAFSGQLYGITHENPARRI